MRIISLSVLREYCDANPDALKPLTIWRDEVKAAQWKSAGDIKATFRSASILPGRRVVFNIKGNDHRLVVSVAFAFGAVYIKFIGTHAEYDAIDVKTVELKK